MKPLTDKNLTISGGRISDFQATPNGFVIHVDAQENDCVITFRTGDLRVVVPKSPAVMAYKKEFGVWPNRGQIADINEKVTDLELWAEVLHTFNLQGRWKKRVDIMLTWYGGDRSTAKDRQVAAKQAVAAREQEEADMDPVSKFYTH